MFSVANALIRHQTVLILSKQLSLIVKGASQAVLLRLQLEVTAYQPVDVVTRTVEVPVTRTVDVYVPKPVVREKVVEVPKLVPKYIEKVSHCFHWLRSPIA